MILFEIVFYIGVNVRCREQLIDRKPPVPVVLNTGGRCQRVDEKPIGEVDIVGRDTFEHGIVVKMFENPEKLRCPRQRFESQLFPGEALLSLIDRFVFEDSSAGGEPLPFRRFIDTTTEQNGSVVLTPNDQVDGNQRCMGDNAAKRFTIEQISSF